MTEKKSYQSNYMFLTEALLSNKGIQHLTDVAFSVFERTIIVIDSSYKILARQFEKDAFRHHSEIYSYLSEGDITSQEFLDRRGITALKKDRIQEELSRRTGSYRFVHSVLGCECIATGIRIKNTLVAYVILIEAGDMLSEEEEQLFETFRDLLGQELQKNQLYQTNRDDYISYLLVDLLNNKYPDEETIRKRLATVDFEPGHHMDVVVMRKRMEEEPLPSMELVLNQIRGPLAGHMYAVAENSVVLLLNFKEKQKLDDRLLDVIQQICVNNDLIAGVGNDFKDMMELPRQYRLATKAALVCQRYVEGHRIIFYDDVFDLALLEYCDRNSNLMDFVHSSILNLMEYDKQYGTNYLYTFWVYTENACNTNATATKMFVHKNTLAYRLGKIKEILGSDLTSGKDLFAFQLSMRILRMLGKLEK